MKVTGKLNRFYLALCVFSGCNLLFSASLAQAPVSVTGSLGIIECTSEDICLTLSPPGALTFGSAPHFLNNNGERLAMITNPLTESGLLRVTDSRPTGYFDIMVDITDLISTDGDKIPKTNIGIMSYNESSDEGVSMDSVPEDPTVVSLIDPDILDADGTPLTYNDILRNPDAILEDWITPFTEVDGILIVSAENMPRHNAYTMGLVFFIYIPVNPANPANPDESLRDGRYEATATFTLITT